MCPKYRNFHVFFFFRTDVFSLQSHATTRAENSPPGSFCNSSVGYYPNGAWSSLETSQVHVRTQAVPTHAPALWQCCRITWFWALAPDSNLYFQPERCCFMLRYVDDLLIFGGTKTTEFLAPELQKQLRMRSGCALAPGILRLVFSGVASPDLKVPLRCQRRLLALINAWTTWQNKM